MAYDLMRQGASTGGMIEGARTYPDDMPRPMETIQSRLADIHARLAQCEEIACVIGGKLAGGGSEIGKTPENTSGVIPIATAIRDRVSRLLDILAAIDRELA